MAEPVKPGCHPENTEGRIFVDPEPWIRNSGFPGSGADSWQEKLIPTADRLPQIIRASP